MLSPSARIGAPVVGFVLGLLVTYGAADAGRGPVPASILQDVLTSRIPTASGLRFTAVGGTADRAAFASFDERFAGAVTPSGSGVRLANLEGPISSNSVRSDIAALKLTALRASSGDRFPNGRSDSFDDRFSGGRAPTAVDTNERAPDPSWVVQLTGDSSEAIALSRFRELQNKHKSLLGFYNPVVLGTTLRPGSEPIWTRVRVELNSRQAAESLCSKLEEAGERCVVQRNVGRS
jgi:hypothetical protein